METLTHEQNYRINIIETTIFLLKSRDETFTKIVNLALAGEFSDFDCPEGEEIDFQLAYFRNCEDQNVQLLLKHLDETQAKIDWLVNVNDVREGELEIEVEY